MKVSALITTYNRRGQVVDAIKSVLAQTVSACEIIVVDDGSEDGTSQAIEEQFGPAVKLVRQKNAGVSAARNRGIREAKGEWVAFLDSDDIWFPDKLARQIQALEAFDRECSLCFSDNTYGRNRDLEYSRFCEVGFIDAPDTGVLDEPAEWIVALREPFFTSSLVVKRTSLLEIDGFDERLTLREDTDLVFRLSLRTGFCFVGDSLVQIDRDPSREDGLCDLYKMRDDRVFKSLELLFTKWLAMPDVAGASYEQKIKERLRGARYDALETWLHDFRIGRALREAKRLRAQRESYSSIFTVLAQRKIAKIRRDFHSTDSSKAPELSGGGC